MSGSELHDWVCAQLREAQIMVVESTFVFYDDEKMERDQRRVVCATLPVNIEWMTDTKVCLRPLLSEEDTNACVQTLMESGMRLLDGVGLRPNTVLPASTSVSDSCNTTSGSCSTTSDSCNTTSMQSSGDGEDVKDHVIRNKCVRLSEDKTSDVRRQIDVSATVPFEMANDPNHMSVLERLLKMMLDYAREHKMSKNEVGDVFCFYPEYATALLKLTLPNRNAHADDLFTCTLDTHDSPYNTTTQCVWRLVPPARLVSSPDWPRNTCEMTHRLLYTNGDPFCAFHETPMWPSVTVRCRLSDMFAHSRSLPWVEHRRHNVTVEHRRHMLDVCAVILHRDVCALVLEYANVCEIQHSALKTMLQCTRQTHTLNCALDDDASYITAANQKNTVDILAGLATLSRSSGCLDATVAPIVISNSNADSDNDDVSDEDMPELVPSFPPSTFTTSTSLPRWFP
jgi:hypothetical protein